MDARTRHLRGVSRLRRASRRWTVLAAVLGGATVVLTPYAGIGVMDAVWAALTGGAVAAAAFRWRDYRAAAALPVPESDPVGRHGSAARRAVRTAVESSPLGRFAVEHVQRQSLRIRFRDSAAGPYADRLEEASRTLAGLTTRLPEPARDAVAEAEVAERELRELAERIVSVERALRFAPAEAREPLSAGHAGMLGQLGDGVTTYERLVAAAAECVAADRIDLAVAPTAIDRLTDAADKLAGFASALAELRRTHTATSPA